MVVEEDLGPGFHAVAVGGEFGGANPAGGHEVGFAEGEGLVAGFEFVNDAEMDAADGSGGVVDDAERGEFVAAGEGNFFGEFALQAGVDEVGRGMFEVVNVATDAEGEFVVEAGFALLFGALEEDVGIATPDADVGNDLFDRFVLLDLAARTEETGFVGDVDDGLGGGGVERAGEMLGDGAGRDN